MTQLCKITLPTGEHRWVGTQGEAKKAAKETGGSWEVVDVATDKQGLLEFVNAMEDQITRSKATTFNVVETAIKQRVDSPPPPRRPEPDLTTDAVESLIQDSEGGTMARLVTSAVCRLGETGEAGRDAVEEHLAAFMVEQRGCGVALYRGAAILNDVAAYTVGNKRGRQSRWS